MPTDANGVYSLPAGYAGETGTTIQVSQHNPPLEDIAAGLSARLMASGVKPWTGPSKFTDGTVGAPSATFGSATTTGWYKTTDGIGFAVSGTLVLEITAAGIKVLGETDFATTAMIADEAITLAKLADLATQRLIGRDTVGTDVPEPVTVQKVLNWLLTTRGDIITRGALDPQRLPLGAAGYVLTSDGTDAVWAVPSRRKLSTQTASASSALEFTSGIDSTYRKYVFEIDNLLPASNDVALLLEVYDGTWRQTGYVAYSFFISSGGSTLASSVTTAFAISANAGGGTGVINTSGYGYSGDVEIITPSNTTTRKMMNLRSGGYAVSAGANLITVNGGSGYWNGGSGAITGVRFRFSTGNIASGDIALYGIP